MRAEHNRLKNAIEYCKRRGYIATERNLQLIKAVSPGYYLVEYLADGGERDVCYFKTNTEINAFCSGINFMAEQIPGAIL